MIETTTSADGTVISFERAGHGDPVLLLGDTRMSSTGLAGHLAPFFTVFTIERSQTAGTPHEIEDVAAVLRVAGGEAYVYGHSSGAELALAVAASRLPVLRLALLDPPADHDLSGIDVPILVVGSAAPAADYPGATMHVVQTADDLTIAGVLEEFFG